MHIKRSYILSEMLKLRFQRKSAKDVLATAAEIRGSLLMLSQATEKKRPIDVQLAPSVQPAASVKIESIEKYLEVCSTQPPLAEGHGCKDVHKLKTFDKFRRRYFVLYEGLLLYYNHKSCYVRDKKNGLVSMHTNIIIADAF